MSLIVAALLFTTAIAVFVKCFVISDLSNFTSKNFIGIFNIIGFLVITGIGFCSVKKVYIDLEHSRFKPAIEVLGIKIGRWRTIHSYEYISVFFQHLSDGGYTYEVNLWYDRNKHMELYKSEDVKEAFDFAFNVSEQLKVDLLDATLKESKWVDKVTLRKELGLK